MANKQLNPLCKKSMVESKHSIKSVLIRRDGLDGTSLCCYV